MILFLSPTVNSKLETATPDHHPFGPRQKYFTRVSTQGTSSLAQALASAAQGVLDLDMTDTVGVFVTISQFFSPAKLQNSNPILNAIPPRGCTYTGDISVRVDQDLKALVFLYSKHLI